MHVQLGAAGDQHSPVEIGVKVIPCEDTAGAPQTLEERGVSLGRGRAPLLPCHLPCFQGSTPGFGAWSLEAY